MPRHGEAEPALLDQARWLRERFGDDGWLATELLALGNDFAWLERMKQVERQSGVRLVAAGDVHFDDNALQGFNGVGNFVVNTGAQNTLQGAITINIMTVAP